jgi:hypothetical protein
MHPVNRMVQADAKFFARRPDRHYRIRLAHQDEIAEHRTLDPQWCVPADLRVYVAVHSPIPGIRLRAFLPAPEGMETESEETARETFDWATGGRFAR